MQIGRICNLRESASQTFAFRDAKQLASSGRRLGWTMRPRRFLQFKQDATAGARSKLAQQLLEETSKMQAKDRFGKPPAAIQDLVDQLKEVANQFGYAEIDAEFLNGDYEGLLFSSEGEQGGDMTLGALSFQQFGPSDLKVSMLNNDASVKGGVFQGRDAPDEYAIATAFQAKEHVDVTGINSVIGSYKIDKEKPYRQLISFERLRLEPGDKSPEGVKRWLAVTKSGNDTMDEQGIVNITFPQPINGFRDYIYMEKDYQIAVGNRGSLSLIRRRQSGL